MKLKEAAGVLSVAIALTSCGYLAFETWDASQQKEADSQLEHDGFRGEIRVNNADKHQALVNLVFGRCTFYDVKAVVEYHLHDITNIGPYSDVETGINGASIPFDNAQELAEILPGNIKTSCQR